jgi:hypothetical protein
VLWVVLFLVIALAGLAMLVGYAVWLAHKTADVFSELRMLGKQTDQLAELLAQIRVPASLSSHPGPRNPSI